MPAPGSEDLEALRIVVRQCLSSLPEAQRLAVTLYHINGYSYAARSPPFWVPLRQP